MYQNFLELVNSIRQCQVCKPDLAHSPKPIIQLHPEARILIAGQAPGRKAHQSGIPFDDPSGDRLREWMGIDKETFYDARKIAILPMGFCYPGHKQSGDLPPRAECAPLWQAQILNFMTEISLTLVVGNYAARWHLNEPKKRTLTDIVKAWKQFLPEAIPLPHPSPRNNRWLHKNPWFEHDLLPVLRARVDGSLN